MAEELAIGLIGTPRAIGAPRRELAAGLPDGYRLTAWPSRVGVFPATPVERAMQDIGHLEAGIAATRAGCAALVIDSLADYGLAALRAAVPVPVVGAGEAGLAAVAQAAGDGRFAIVTVWPESMDFLTHDLLRAHGMAARCLPIRHVGDEAALENLSGPDGYLSQIGRAADAIVARARAEIAAAVQDGAQAVLLGCTCMSPMAARVADGAAVPVINPLAAAVARAVAAPPAPGAEAITHRADLIARMVDGLADAPDEACPVCAVASAFDG
ncbi:hypothetical protein GTZ99_01165 [Novosphingobium sp. FSY-8]|uniref:Asp/Glu/hydantoin racemase n=1 Tax=Novosphingobium ovatum TaxID=1908523 RepID=A0ABW9X9F7_9SPHN|nr:aspartate/glutamate racemase family protein [Novosphingobium ovatum]NBC35164.1 hypothetical protein [Novosphingobium ovatum]